METPEPTAEHRWLQRLLGDWIWLEGGEDQETEATDTGWRERVRSIGDLWVQAEGSGTMPDGNPGTTQLTLGYDPDRRRFVGTFIGSMMTHLWVYDGELDAEGRVLTLHVEGPDEDGSMAQYRDVIEILGDGHRTLTSYIEREGSWKQFMRAEYRRESAPAGATAEPAP